MSDITSAIVDVSAAQSGETKRSGKKRHVSLLVASIIAVLFVLILITHKRRKRLMARKLQNYYARNATPKSSTGFLEKSLQKGKSLLKQARDPTGDAARALQMAQELKSSLATFSMLGHDFMQRVQQAPRNDGKFSTNPLLPGGENTMIAVGALTTGVDEFSIHLARAMARENCSGLQKVYEGLSASDGPYIETAKRLRNIGFELNQVLNIEGTAMDLDLAAAADDLIAMLKQMRVVVADIHKLGEALDLE